MGPDSEAAPTIDDRQRRRDKQRHNVAAVHKSSAAAAFLAAEAARLLEAQFHMEDALSAVVANNDHQPGGGRDDLGRETAASHLRVAIPLCKAVLRIRIHFNRSRSAFILFLSSSTFDCTDSDPHSFCTDPDPHPFCTKK